MSDDRTKVVDRVAEAIYVAKTMTPEESYDAALEFWAERERRRGEWEAKQESEEKADHPFEPAQGQSDACLNCGKRKSRHE